MMDLAVQPDVTNKGPKLDTTSLQGIEMHSTKSKLHPFRSWLSALLCLLLFSLAGAGVGGCSGSPPGEGVTDFSAEEIGAEKPAFRSDAPGAPGPDAAVQLDDDEEVEAAVADQIR